LPNVGPYIYDVSISGFTRSSIYIYDISSLRVNECVRMFNKRPFPKSSTEVGKIQRTGHKWCLSESNWITKYFMYHHTMAHPQIADGGDAL